MAAPLIAALARVLASGGGRAAGAAAGRAGGRLAAGRAASGGGGGGLARFGTNMLFGGGNVQGKPAAFGQNALTDVGEPAQTAGRGLQRLADAAKEGVIGFVKMPGILADVNRQLLENQRVLSQFNGQIAVAFAELERSRTQRKLQLAQQTSGSVKQLAQSEDRLEKALQPYNVAITNASNKLFSFLSDIASNVLEYFEPVIDAVNWWMGNEKTKIENPPAVRFLADVAAGRFQPGNNPRAQELDERRKAQAAKQDRWDIH